MTGLELQDELLRRRVLLATVTQTLAAGRYARAQGVEANAAAVETIGLLTNREQQVREGLVSGQANKAIADGLVISPCTIEVHRAHPQEKRKARGLPDLVHTVRSATASVPGRSGHLTPQIPMGI